MRFRTCRQTRKAAGFTLVELLVVIGVICLLIGLGLPSLAKVRVQAGMVRCQTNMRQWMAAAQVYANDYDGFLPRRGQGTQVTTNIARQEDWFNALPPLLNMPTYASLVAQNQMPGIEDGTLWCCPGAVRTGAGNYFGYAMNMALSTWNSPTPDKMSRVGPTGTMVFMAEGNGQYCSTFPSALGYSPMARHGTKTNIVFLDGHVSAFEAGEVGCGVGDPKRDDVRWVVPNGAWQGP